MEIKQIKPITVDEIFVLVKTLREYKQALPREDVTVMERYRANILEEAFNKILTNGIEYYIGHYNEKKFALIARAKAKEALEGDGCDN
jgi:hypothetical protein